ncbi:hypothetical protein AA0472_2525 [Acetobacter estunensis NRIC 0472]|uniref:hypothetical protein n=1 Tax=Acetobacter estunensis TaxID=104097 RepID=UPI001407FE20|nr:hypothetical protein [Acetobacter estunensis]GBQ27862.1 hypothetical protein AA0472_2525 [Acetobacter estunensis NRIC 0472]
MKRVAWVVLCGFSLAGCSWFGDDTTTANRHLTQKEQWETLGYKDGLKSVRTQP